MTGLETPIERISGGCAPSTPRAGRAHVVGLPAAIDETAAVHASRSGGLAVSPLRAYFAGLARMPGLVLGFVGTPRTRSVEAARGLDAAVRAAADRAGIG
jgi:DNA-binding transcriptional MocR family regulator